MCGVHGEPCGGSPHGPAVKVMERQAWEQEVERQAWEQEAER